MDDSSNDNNPLAFLDQQLTAWKLVGSDCNYEDVPSSNSRGKYLLKAIRIAHAVGHRDELSAEVISNVVRVSNTFDRVAKHLKTIEGIFEKAANRSLGIDTVIAEARDKRRWLNYRSKNDDSCVDNATSEQIVRRRRLINSVSMAYENALAQGTLPDLIDEVSAYEEEFRWMNRTTNYTVIDYVDGIKDPAVIKMLECEDFGTLSLPHKKI